MADTVEDTCYTHGNVKGKALNNLLAGTLPEKKCKILGDTLADVKATPLVDTLPDILR